MQPTNPIQLTDAQTKLLKRTLWLAFQASIPVGMGHLHAEAAESMTEDVLFNSVKDDLRRHWRTELPFFDTDYLFGRMMKTAFIVNEDTIIVEPEQPRADYQSWAMKYPTGSALVNAAVRSLKD